MQVALAWLLRRAPNILLIPGTSSVAHLRENLAAGELTLSLPWPLFAASASPGRVLIDALHRDSAGELPRPEKLLEVPQRIRQAVGRAVALQGIVLLDQLAQIGERHLVGVAGELARLPVPDALAQEVERLPLAGAVRRFAEALAVQPVVNPPHASAFVDSALASHDVLPVRGLGTWRTAVRNRFAAR